MKMKKLSATILAMALLVSVAAVPASAANSAIETMEAWMGGGATVSSQSARKNVTRNSLYYNAKPATSDGWSKKGDEWVYFRGRSSTNAQATDLGHEQYFGTMREEYLPYKTGFGSVGKYFKMAIQYDSDNPYQFVNLRVGWAP